MSRAHAAGSERITMHRNAPLWLTVTPLPPRLSVSVMRLLLFQFKSKTEAQDVIRALDTCMDLIKA